MSLLLSACAPKYGYNRAAENAIAIEKIRVVLDYTHFVDDVGELFDYDLIHNQNRAEELQTDIDNMLRQKGYGHDIEFVLVASGVGFNPDMGFEHYEGNTLMDDLIYPPFYVHSSYPVDTQNELMNSWLEGQRIALTPVSEDTQNYLTVVRMNPINFSFLDSIDISKSPDRQDVAVLHVRVLAPRVSFVKAMGVSMVTAGLTMGATGGAYVSMAVPMGRPHSTALLFDNQGGHVQWKNFSLGDLSRFSENGFNQFFKDFPAKP